MYKYSPAYCAALLVMGRRMGSFTWDRQGRYDYVAMYRMGGEL